MKIKRIFTIIKREFLTRVMKRSFLIFTILTPLLFAALMILPSLMWTVKGGKTPQVLVLDETNFFYEKLKEKAIEPHGKGIEDIFIEFSKPVGGEKIEDIIPKIYDSKEIDAVLEIKLDDKNDVSCTYYGKNISNIRLIGKLENYLNSINLEEKLKKNNIPDEVKKELQKKVEIKAVKIEKGGKTKKSSFFMEYFKTFIASMLLYLLIIGYGQTLMRGVMEEKSNRVVEILLSSLKPSELLLGKILGIASVGLLQYLIWLICGIALFIANPMNFTSSIDKSTIRPEELLLFVIFFVLGFFFYASIFGAVGSICSTDQEVQQLMYPIVLILIFPVLILGLILQNPNAPWLIVLSLIPIFSPTLMMTRVSIMAIPFWQILLSIILLILGIAFVSWAGGKIFRTGILMTGKMPSIFEVVKWLKA